MLTAEIEHVDAGILAELEARGGCDVHPSSGTLAIIQVFVVFTLCYSRTPVLAALQWLGHVIIWAQHAMSSL